MSEDLARDVSVEDESLTTNPDWTASSAPLHQLDLATLESVCPRVPPSYLESCRERCIVSLEHHGHESGVNCEVNYDGDPSSAALAWHTDDIEQITSFYQDNEEKVQHGAYAVSMLLAPRLTGYSVIRQARKGASFDFYLSNNSLERLPFNEGAFLEVSGILEETSTNTVSKRVRDKVNRFRDNSQSSLRTSPDLPTYVCVVEFGRPQSQFVQVRE